VKSVSARNFTRNVAACGPVFIADRGRPAFVLLGIEDYCRVAGKGELSLLATMGAIRGGEGIEFGPLRLNLRSRAADLTGSGSS